MKSRPGAPRAVSARPYLITLGVIVAVLAAAWVAALAAFPPSRLTPLVRDGLSRALKAPVALREARLALDPLPAIELRDVLVGDPFGYRRPAAWPRGGVAQAGRVAIALDVWALLGRRLALQGATLADARVTAVRNEAGVGNWEGLGGGPAAPRPAGGPALDVSLDRLRLSNVRVSTYDARDGAWFDVRRIDGVVSYAGRGSASQHVAVALTAAGIGGRTPWPIGGRPIALTLDVEHVEPGARWLVRAAKVTRGALTLSGHGEVTGADQVLAFQLDQATLPLDALLELCPKDEVKSLGDLTARGDVRVALAANGPLSHGRTPHVRARVMLDGGRLAFRARSVAIEGLGVDIAASEAGATVNRLQGRVGRSVFDVTGDVAGWADPRARLRVRGNADLADIAGFLPFADSTKLGGRMDVDAQAAGRVAEAGGANAAESFGVSGSMGLHGVSASGIGLGVPVSGVEGTIGLLPGRAFAQGLVARIGRSDIAVDATIDRPWSFARQLGGHAKASDAAAAARFALRSRYLDANELVPARASTGPLPRVHASGTVSIDSLALQRLTAGHVQGRVTYADGVTQVDDIALVAYGGKTTGTGTFDLSDASRPRYKLHLAADQVDANQVLSAWTNARNVAFGAMRMTLDLDGAGLAPKDIAQSLTAQGLAQVLGGKLAGATVFAELARFTGVDRFRILSFRDLSAPFHVTKGRIVFDPLALTTGGTDWLAQGSVGLDGSLDFHVAALVPPADVPALPAQLTRTAGALLDPSGKLTLDCLLSGDVTHPRFGWDTQRTMSRLAARAPEALVGALTNRVGGALADSLTRSRGGVAAQADALVQKQKQDLTGELERQKQTLGQGAAQGLLDALFKKPVAPPPPPATDSLASPAPAKPPAPGAPADTAH